MSGRRGAGIVWVASYPKSGNTWMRFLLTHLLFGGPDSSADVEACIPNLGGMPGERLTLPRDEPVMLKTHWTYTERFPAFRETLGIVYLVRNPLDVMLSFFNFNLLRFLPGEQALDAERVAAARRQYIDTFIRHRGNPLRQTGIGHTDWVQNVKGWLAACQRHPGLVVRYEDMLSDPEYQLRRVLQFLCAETDDAAVRAALRESSFEALRAREEREIRDKRPGFFYRRSFEQAQQRGIRFMREGKASATASVLDADQRSAFDDAFGAALASLGYGLDVASGQMQTHDSPLAGVRALAATPRFGHARVEQGGGA